MNSALVDGLYSWTGSFVEAITTLTCDVANLIYASLSLTSNATTTSSSSSSSSGSGDSSSSSSSGSGDGGVSGNGNDNDNANPVSSGEKALPNIPQVLQEAVSLFAFDDFQYLLLKIFLAIILSNLCLIYIAWYIYGTRITERFMTQNKSAEEVKRGVSKLKLPKQHSQRHA